MAASSRLYPNWPASLGGLFFAIRF